MKQKRNERGITLIALVITIIVLIILAGVGINAIMGEDGLISRAKRVKEEQKIAEITDKLELEKGTLYVNEQGPITVGTYLEHIKSKGIIEQEDIETISEVSSNITVEGKYIFLVEKEDNENIKIEYLGAVGNITPKIKTLELTNTTNSIGARITAKYAENATYKYYIKAEETGEYEEIASINNSEYTFEGLNQNVKYYVKVEVINPQGSKAEQEATRTTGNVEGLTSTNTTFTYVPENWTNGNVTVTVSTTVTGYTLQTSTDGENWSSTNTQTLSSNGPVYARLVDSTNQANGYAAGNVEKIDTTVPEITTDINESDVTVSDVKVNVGIKDINSGISKIEWYYKISTDTSYTSSTDTYTGMNGSNAGETSAVTKSKQLSDLTPGTYNVYAKVYDVAGNCSTTKTITVNLAIPNASQIQFTPSDSTWEVTTVQQALDYLRGEM